jgi:hypothetical protein
MPSIISASFRKRFPLFSPGDLVFQAATGIKPVSAEHVDHVMICIEPMPVPRFAHAAVNGVRQGKFRPDKFKHYQLRGFSCYNSALALKAVQYAKYWAASSGVEISTGFSLAQGELVNQLKQQKGYDPAFGADAMRRAFKWAARTGRPLSRIRESPQQKGGVTCPLFVVACYQAAAISLELDEKTIQRLANEYGEVKRSPANLKFRQFSEMTASTLLRAAMKKPETSATIPKRIVKGAQEMLESEYGFDFFASIMPPSLVLDAKYVSVNWLYDEIVKDTENWHPVCDWQSLPEAPPMEKDSNDL